MPRRSTGWSWGRLTAASVTAIAAVVACTVGTPSSAARHSATVRSPGLVSATRLTSTPTGPTSDAVTGPRIRIVIDGNRAGPVFQGIGAISGGGGNSRLLIDYRAAERGQILDYLFGPGGADLDLLKLEIGGDANSTDGAEPSVEHSRGQIDCSSGYEWWLAAQAVARNPGIKLYGLQWAAPGWVGAGGRLWTQADIGYLIDWLNCARSHGLTISYLGGWNETGYWVPWYTALRRALNANGFGSVQIVAADDGPFGRRYDPAAAWQVASAAASDPAFLAAISVIGVHDTCGGPTTGYHCFSTAAARRLGLPLWESEVGAMDANTGAADMVRTINNGYIQAGVTGYLEWPLVDSMAPGLPLQNRGLITADQPESGYYRVNLMTWAIAQTTQFVQPGWRHVTGASGPLGDSGTYNAYLAPDLSDWSLVAENTGHYAGQRVRPLTISVRLTAGLRSGVVRVWATNLRSADPAHWFVQRQAVRPSGGAFSYTIEPGFVVTFTSTSGQSHARWPSPAPAAMGLPYLARPDPSNEAWGLGAQDGAFVYAPCQAGEAGRCIQQMAIRTPVWWGRPGHGRPFPYAVVGSARWANYTVAARVLLGNATGSAGLIGRFSHQRGGANANLFDGYAFALSGSGRWHLYRNSDVTGLVALAAGRVRGFRASLWHRVALSLDGPSIVASVDGHVVARITDRAYRSGIAGITSGWSRIQFDDLTVRAAQRSARPAE